MKNKKWPMVVLHALADGWSRWTQPAVQNFELSCCDCGLVHDVQFRLDKGALQFRVRRNEAATAEERKVPHKCMARNEDSIADIM